MFREESGEVLMDLRKYFRTFKSGGGVELHSGSSGHHHLYGFVCRKDSAASYNGNTNGLRELVDAPQSNRKDCFPGDAASTTPNSEFGFCGGSVYE